ncbi:MAG: DUF488 domain-containing protein [Candidatus Omnitrophica bacterium]|nr:DUF488 domain-containing protein [Candidatus Omnitrophota bacterium]
MNLSKLITIGVYGYTEEEFFDSLKKARVDTFCDIRRRRGLRGSKYAFANSERLQERLEEMGIRYLHFKDLSPSEKLIRYQGKVDQEQGVPRRERSDLCEEFIEGYENEVLKDFDASAFVEELGPEASRIALFCVEGEPTACHRSLLANYLAKAMGVKVEHLRPG